MDIQVQSFLNSATKLTISVTSATTVEQLKDLVSVAEGVNTNIMAFYYNDQELASTSTLATINVSTSTYIRSSNIISTLPTKEERQKSKLDLAAAKRVVDGKSRATYDITQLPTQYNGDDIINNPNIGGLVIGRPWIDTVNTFTFYEAFGTTTAISTTQYVSGNKIYAESSTYDVPDFQPALVVVNDIEVVNTELRGHTLVVLDSYGDVVTTSTQYDTYIDPNKLTELASDLTSVDSGNIVVLVVYDASAVNAAVRSAINTGYGSTNTDTWTAQRRSQIFIGVKS